MDKKNKIFFAVLFLLIVGSVGATYWRIMVKKDYIIESQVDCDPETEKCFVWECDPESSVEGEACTGDAEADIWYYKLKKRKASNIPLCNPEEDENCDPFACDENEKGCEEIFCNDENKIEQEVECNDPEEYLKNNPPEEDEELEEEEVEVEAEEEVEGEMEEGETETEIESEEGESEENSDEEEAESLEVEAGDGEASEETE